MLGHLMYKTHFPQAMGKFYVKSSQQYQDDADEMEEVIAETQDQIISYLSKSLRTAKHVKMEQKHYEVGINLKSCRLPVVHFFRLFAF